MAEIDTKSNPLLNSDMSSKDDLGDFDEDAEISKLEDQFLDSIKSKIVDMQGMMQNAYGGLAETLVTGYSKCKTVDISLSATYDFKGINFGKEALNGGVTAFKSRIAEAFTDVIERIKTTTESTTKGLLEQMDMPDDWKKMTEEFSTTDNGKN